VEEGAEGLNIQNGISGSSVKIRDISVHLVKASWRNFTIVKLTTDEGLIGFGEGTLGDFEKTIEAAVYDYRPLLIGMDVDVPAITNFMYDKFYWHGGPILMSAMSAIEQALWDVLGKSANRPVYSLMGGKRVDRVRTYVNGFISGSASAKEFGAAAAEVVKAGFDAMKFDPFGAAGPRISSEGMRTSLQRIDAVKDAVGENVDIIIEAHGRFDPETAVMIAQELKTYSPLWFEEPIREDNIREMADVRSKSQVTIATGERLVSNQSFKDILSAKAADIVQPDVCHIGGIRALCEVASMAETDNVDVAPHNPNGPIATAATLNAMLTMNNGLILEYWIDADPVRRALVKEYFDVRNGYLSPPTKPGLGIEVREEALSKYPYEKLHLAYFTDNYKYHDPKPK
jgi:galactonate dehydratase